MLEIYTNSLVESWHNILNSLYLEGARKQRIDILAYRLLEEAFKDLRIKVASTPYKFMQRVKIWPSRDGKMRVISSLMNSLHYSLEMSSNPNLHRHTYSAQFLPVFSTFTVK